MIYDPLTTVRNPDGTYTRTPFANSIIPADRLNQVGMNIAGYYPQPESQAAFSEIPTLRRALPRYRGRGNTLESSTTNYSTGGVPRCPL